MSMTALGAAEIASPLTRGPERSPESRFAMPRWWMTQSGANHYPVGNSLLDRENTGNLVNSSGQRGVSWVKSLAFTRI
jgi:hypothetical protein